MPTRHLSRGLSSLDARRPHGSSDFVDLVALLHEGLVQRAGVTNVRAGHFLFRTREKGDSMVLVLAGVVAVTQERDGNTVFVELCGPGSLVGLEAVSLGRPHSATATTVSPCRIARVSRSDFRDILARQPQAASAVLLCAATQLTDRMRATSQLRTGNGRRHLAWLLHEMLNKAAVRRSDGAFVLPFRISVTRLGQLAGIGREAASRAIGHFRRNGFVVKENGLFIVPRQSPLRPANISQHEQAPWQRAEPGTRQC